MKSRFTVLLNDVSLNSLSDDICITDISYPAPEISYTVSNYAGRNGGIVSGKRMDATAVMISFELHVYGTRERQNVCSEIVRWAKDGGKLQTSDRVDQYLQCVCTRLPSIESAENWTDNLTVEFTAYSIPYWMAIYPSETVISGADAEGEVFVPGNAETLPDVEITAGNSITEVTVGFGETSITLTGLTMSAGDVIRITHDENGILYIKTGETSLLSKRTVTSSDDLTAECGNIPVSVSSDGSVTAIFRARGVWH